MVLLSTEVEWRAEPSWIFLFNSDSLWSWLFPLCNFGHLNREINISPPISRSTLFELFLWYLPCHSEDMSSCVLYSRVSISFITLYPQWCPVQCLAHPYRGVERILLSRAGFPLLMFWVDDSLLGGAILYTVGCLAAIWPLTTRYQCTFPQVVTTKGFSRYCLMSWGRGTKSILVENCCSRDWEI